MNDLFFAPLYLSEYIVVGGGGDGAGNVSPARNPARLTPETGFEVPMHMPPFRRAQPSRLKLSADTQADTGIKPPDSCCSPANAAPPNAKRRARLAELDNHLHCSIIGTCLSTHELQTGAPIHQPRSSGRDDLEIHHSAVELAIGGGAGAKALHKSLDEHYAAAVHAVSIKPPTGSNCTSYGMRR